MICGEVAPGAFYRRETTVPGSRQKPEASVPEGRRPSSQRFASATVRASDQLSTTLTYKGDPADGMAAPPAGPMPPNATGGGVGGPVTLDASNTGGPTGGRAATFRYTVLIGPALLTTYR